MDRGGRGGGGGGRSGAVCSAHVGPGGAIGPAGVGSSWWAPPAGRSCRWRTDRSTTPVRDSPRRRRLARHIRAGMGRGAHRRRQRGRRVELEGRGEVLVGSTHNHHGPDTWFDINHQWYEHMTDQAADAVVEAIGDLRPARLRAGEGEHWFRHGRRHRSAGDRSPHERAAGGRHQRAGHRHRGPVEQHLETTLNWAPPADISAKSAGGSAKVLVGSLQPRRLNAGRAPKRASRNRVRIGRWRACT